MLQIFLTESQPEDFKQVNQNLFPDAPTKCMFKDCNMPVKMHKHGYYKRYVITQGFCDYVYIRRYICPSCKHTVSFMPSFLTPQFQYVTPYVIKFLQDYFYSNQSIRKYTDQFYKENGHFSRRHLKYYSNRLFSNHKSIQQYFISTKQNWVNVDDMKDSRTFVKVFLEEVNSASINHLLWDFFSKTGSSILSPNN